jgi:hypothetical protein
MFPYRITLAQQHRASSELFVGSVLSDDIRTIACVIAKGIMKLLSLAYLPSAFILVLYHCAI